MYERLAVASRIMGIPKQWYNAPCRESDDPDSVPLALRRSSRDWNGPATNAAESNRLNPIVVSLLARPTVAHRGRQNADNALALALARGVTLRDAATEAGVGERTATRRWADLAFRQHVTELKHEMVARSVGRLSDGMVEAADTLRKLLTAESESVRLGAARAMLELGVKVRDAVEISERVAALERLAAVQAQGDGI